MPTTSLERFREAQKEMHLTAKCELASGAKRTHWIWYIFPQLKGLGHSNMCKHYDIQSGDEACAYLQDESLFKNYVELLSIVKIQLTKGISLNNLFNGSTDAKKFISSLTLFNLAAKHLLSENFYQLSAFVELTNNLLKIIQTQGYKTCTHTRANCTFTKF